MGRKRYTVTKLLSLFTVFIVIILLFVLKPDIRNGIWYVEYYSDYHAKSADDLGRVTEVEDGYFVAHDWSPAGRLIKSKYSIVSVEGCLYEYEGSIIVEQGTNFAEIREFVYDDGGIGFQTCCDDGYLINHYEPVEIDQVDGGAK